MKHILLATLAAAALTVGVGHADAAARVKIGVLSCDVEAGTGYIIGSSKNMTCFFKGDGYRSESYRGNITKFGLDIGHTHHTHIEWIVLAATSTHYARHALAGEYIGASAEGTIGVGVGANWLIGGSHKSFALQPISVQGQTGFDVSLALSNLTLR